MTSSLLSLTHHTTTTTSPLVLHNPTKTTRRFTLSLPKRHSGLTVTNSNHHENASTSEIDLVRNKDGVYAPKQATKVVILWDLDNKPPRGSPYEAARALRSVGERFGRVMEMSAYANRHAFIHVPEWVVEERRERREQDMLERKGMVWVPENWYVCGVCGRKCKSNMELKKHFKQLHERERQKKLSRMRALKGKKRQRFKERFVSGNVKYREEARRLLTPKLGYGLESELRRAGVYVRTVEDKPQAADWALKRQIEHSITRGVDWLFLVSDDSDFSDILRKAREASLGTIVVGDRDRPLGRIADLWVPWIGVENGELSDTDLVPKRRRRRRRHSTSVVREGFDDVFSVSCFHAGAGVLGSEFDGLFDGIVQMTQDFNGMTISEDGQDYILWDSEDDEVIDDILWDSEDDEVD